MPERFRALFVFTVAAALLAVAAAPANAQVLYGSIIGTIEDPTGAVVPNATVTIINTETGATREVQADSSGRYSIQNVVPGRYDVTIKATGFRSVQRTGLDVSINQVTREDIKLEVGQVTETINVQASAVLLQTDKSEVRSQLTTQTLTNLPLPAYRNYQSLINLVPGATPAEFQNAVVDTPGRGLTTNVNGTARNNNNTLVDGAVNTFIWLPHHTVYVQPVESIAEVNITTGSMDAEQGMAGGAAITLTTKSGTNDIHGVGFWFHNNQHLNSAPYFKSATFRKPVGIFNQAGGTLGGPIVKDKLFYFGSIEQTWERSAQQGNYSVPPAEWRNGDFSRWTNYAVIYDPMSNPNPALRTPFPNNTIPRERISTIFNAIQQRIPLPNQTSPTDPNNLQGTFNAQGTLKLNRTNYDGKINYNATQNLVVWGKFSHMTAPVEGLYPFGEMGGAPLGTEGIGDTKVYIPTVGFTYTFSPTFVMDGVFGYTRFDQTVGLPNADRNVGLEDFRIPGTNGGRLFANDLRYGGVPQFSNLGFSDWGFTAGWTPLFRNDRSYTYQTNFSKIYRSHEFRWGFEPRRHEMNHWQPETANPRGQISFASGATQIPGQQGREPNQYAAALLGLVGSYSKSIQFFDMKTREWQLAWYVRDRWQATRNLTLNLGLRYEYYPLINRGDRGIERWDPYSNTVFLGGINNVDNGIKVSKKLFAPRVGFAYRMGDNWVIRSGYGLTYDPIPFSRPLRGLYPATLTGGWGSGLPEAQFRNHLGVPDNTFGYFNTLTQGIPDVPTPDVSQGTLQLPLNVDMGPRSPWTTINRGYIQSWNFTIERKLPADIVTSVAYVGTKTVHQLLDRNINVAGPGTLNNADLPLARMYGRQNNANMWDGIGDGSYNSLQVQMNKSFSHGLLMKGAYTWSKTLNMADDTGWAGLALWHWEPMIQRNYAPAGYDRRHMFTMAWVYELPVGRGRPTDLGGIANAIIGGWNISGQFSAYTGTPFTVTGSAQSLRCAGGSACAQTADLVRPLNKIGNKGPGQFYYDPNSFRDPLVFFNPNNPNYRPGTTGRNAFYGPGFWRLDPLVSKTFTITERVRTEFRAEAFNITNTPRWNNPSTGAGGLVLANANDPLGAIATDAQGRLRTNNFMSITGAGGLRSIRFGLRTTF